MMFLVMCLPPNMIIFPAATFPRLSEKISWDSTIVNTTTKANMASRRKTCSDSRNMSSINIFGPSKRSSSMDSKRMIEQGQAQRLFSEKWCATTLAKLFHYSLIRKYFGEESQRNYSGSSKDRPTLMNLKKRTSRFGQATARKNTWIVLESIEKLEILDLCMDFSGAIGMRHMLIGILITQEKESISYSGSSTKSKEILQAEDSSFLLGTLLSSQKWLFLQYLLSYIVSSAQSVPSQQQWKAKLHPLPTQLRHGPWRSFQHRQLLSSNLLNRTSYRLATRLIHPYACRSPCLQRPHRKFEATRENRALSFPLSRNRPFHFQDRWFPIRAPEASWVHIPQKNRNEDVSLILIGNVKLLWRIWWVEWSVFTFRFLGVLVDCGDSFLLKTLVIGLVLLRNGTFFLNLIN